MEGSIRSPKTFPWLRYKLNRREALMQKPHPRVIAVYLPAKSDEIKAYRRILGGGGWDRYEPETTRILARLREASTCRMNMTQRSGRQEDAFLRWYCSSGVPPLLAKGRYVGITVPVTPRYFAGDGLGLGNSRPRKDPLCSGELAASRHGPC